MQADHGSAFQAEKVRVIPRAAALFGRVSTVSPSPVRSENFMDDAFQLQERQSSVQRNSVRGLPLEALGQSFERKGNSRCEKKRERFLSQRRGTDSPSAKERGGFHYLAAKAQTG